MNEVLSQIVDACVPEDQPEVRARLKEQLAFRDEEILHRLRMSASQQGLRPSMTQLSLCTTGLGDDPEPDALALLQQQAMGEMAEIQAANAYITSLVIRDQEGGGSG